MASSYSSNLKIELMATGENSGTWGTVTNTNLGTAMEQAVIGYGNPDYTSDANLTISITNSNASQAARCLVLNVTSVFGALTATRELIVPTSQKQYIVQNNTTGGQSITVKTSAGTGITVPNGRKAHLYVDGTNVIQMFDFVDINGGAIDGTPIGASSASTGAFTTLTSNGATTFTAGTASTTTGTGTLVITGGLGVSGRINAANFDGIVGANTAAAGSFTTVSVAPSGATNPVEIRGLSNFPTYGAISFNSAYASTTILGLYAGASGDTNLHLNAPTTKSIFHEVAGATITTTSSTGLAVTGTLSTTGNITNSNSAGRLDFTGGSSAQVWATASSLYLDASSGQSVIIRPNNQVTAGTFSSTGLAVTGAITATGAITSDNAITLAGSGGDATFARSEAAGSPMAILMRKSRGTSTAPTTVNNGDSIGAIYFQPYTSSSGYIFPANIQAGVVGAVTSTSAPTDLLFSTGATSATERMRIASSGPISMGFTGTGASGVTDALRVWTSTALLVNNAAAYLGTNGPAASITATLSNNWKTNLLFKVNTVDTDSLPTTVGMFSQDGYFSVGYGSSNPPRRLTVYEGGANAIRIIQDHGTSNAYGIEFNTQAGGTPYQVAGIVASHGSSYVNPFMNLQVADSSRNIQTRLTIGTTGNLTIPTAGADITTTPTSLPSSTSIGYSIISTIGETTFAENTTPATYSTVSLPPGTWQITFVYQLVDSSGSFNATAAAGAITTDSSYGFPTATNSGFRPDHNIMYTAGSSIVASSYRGRVMHTRVVTNTTGSNVTYYLRYAVNGTGAGVYGINGQVVAIKVY